MTAQNALDFEVRRTDLNEFRIAPAPDSEQRPLDPGQVWVRVDRFAFTANNITYAVAGDMLSYWSFFPAPEGWGRIPVWGFADVVRSGHGELSEGERIYGYFPMSTHLVLQPDGLSPGGFVDVSAHRSQLPVVYNQYTRVTGDPGYDPQHEDQQALFRPLFTTAFLLDDFLASADFFGARAIVLASASSKTAIGLAFLLSRRGGAEVIGLTAPGNRKFVENLGCYDRVFSYDEIDALPAELPVALVDMAGNGSVVGALHRHFGDNMRHSCQVGATHWQKGGRESGLPGAEPSFFFAPTQAVKRAQDWGAAGFQQRLGEAWTAFLAASEPWFRVVRGAGPAAVERVYTEMLAGKAEPADGHVLSLWAADPAS